MVPIVVRNRCRSWQDRVKSVNPSSFVGVLKRFLASSESVKQRSRNGWGIGDITVDDEGDEVRCEKSTPVGAKAAAEKVHHPSRCFPNLQHRPHLKTVIRSHTSSSRQQHLYSKKRYIHHEPVLSLRSQRWPSKACHQRLLREVLRGLRYSNRP